jgi:hypothetical protein
MVELKEDSCPTIVVDGTIENTVKSNPELLEVENLILDQKIDTISKKSSHSVRSRRSRRKHVMEHMASNDDLKASSDEIKQLINRLRMETEFQFH